MLTHCPECKGELSTNANVCPHCGAPVDHGRLASGGAPPAGAAAPAAFHQPITAPPKGHALRNCCGCIFFLLVLFGLAVGFVFMKMKQGWQPPEAAPGVAATLAPGSQPPAGWAYLGADDITIFGKMVSKAVVLSPGGRKPERGAPVPLMGAAAFGIKPERRAELRQVIEEAIDKMATEGKPVGKHSKIVSESEETYPLGPGTDTTKVSHIVSENEDTKEKSDTFLAVVEPYDNEFGWVVLFGMGPEKQFDAEAFKAYLKTVKPPAAPAGSTPPAQPTASTPPAPPIAPTGAGGK